MFPSLVTISWFANKGKLPWLALEKKSEDDDAVSDVSNRRSSLLDDESNAAQKSHHPRLKMRASVAAAAMVTAGTRKSHVVAEAQRDADGEDKEATARSSRIQ